MDARRLDELVQTACSSSQPTLWLLHADSELRLTASRRANRLGVFPAAFNPPTFAHVSLLERARRQENLDHVLLVLSARNADKGDMLPSLRHCAAMLEQLFRKLPWVTLALSSHAYFPDMLGALRALAIEGPVSFLVGYDTLERLLDADSRYFPRYFDPAPSREAALERFFSQCSCVVADRQQGDPRALDALLAAHGANAWRPNVRYLRMPAGMQQISSSAVRQRLRNNETIHQLVPQSIARYVTEHGLYR